MPRLNVALDRARRHAPFLAHVMERHGEITALLEADRLDDALEAAWACGKGEDVPAALRGQRQALALVLAIGDLAGVYDFEKISGTLSDFADTACDRAITYAIQRRMPDAGPCGFAIIALGKHGGQELNYSSDIDPIFLYDPETLPRRPRDEPADAAQRMARTVIDTLSGHDENGYVFRVDMRLRPASEVSPLAIPVEAAITHYESSALPWEQAAFIRARHAAGDAQLGQYFMDSIRPFVWRRSLDFGTIDEIGRLTSQIRDHYASGQILGGGFDLKRGRGGIREIEFFAQAHQLIHGGRNRDLRTHRTVQALSALADAAVIDASEAEQLSEHYRLLRTIEHRLQMVNDRQTHELPEDADALDNVARLHGLNDRRALIGLLEKPIEYVGQVYDRLIAADQDAEEDRPRLSEDRVKLARQLADLGFADANGLAASIEKWRGGSIRSLRSTSGKRAFEIILPDLMAVLGRAPDPENAVRRFGSLIAALPSAINFFRLLEARPALMQMLADILSLTPVLADELARRSDLLDGLIDASALDPLGEVEELADVFAHREQDDDYQRVLDNVRLRVGEKRFALGVQLIEGGTDALTVASGYSHVAEAALTSLADATVAEFEETHGRVSGCELVILALGRLGGQALTHASDLDLIFLFTGEIGGTSDGKRPLGATQYFNRLAQRVIAALSVPTASGALYEVDTRLRPSGMQGLLCVTLDSFWQYQREQAWVWEHMALCRARTVYGPADVRAGLAHDIAAFLAEKRENEKVLTDASVMRRDMAAHKQPKGPLDIKLAPGGLVDLEFILHAVQLTHGEGLHPSLGRALAELGQAGLLSPGLGEAHALMTRMLLAVRLVAPDCQEPTEAAKALIALGCHMQDWQSVMKALSRVQQTVRDEWRRIFGTDLHGMN
ncbi:bifunctional [glutamine synthetase] adenylyltransferase/[glutamine synthetase]-adenylyl-L-tyrosine phosphorylase [Sphingorhabdus sp. Alg239-R122]|uniref:bifunctional [glutamine synthetase] adenylyltransferase/[glutamine synthetase]-adenylyl-L-tyrosine phosphorylase n=1 Tax=Sphingorhabdus sp. Alg239-R122 TaxID=2305989 RepID=UPI0013DBE509|nr:bifunctional [glutamine synthetase] adenylyltransferase/[glutamine synthetase]-adenylyl-L-tyrosine phosphorylase [Sphingorhabdus sp. Alg239-R122]